ncbi:MAG TPA: alpha/beta fold hydrolase [Polyangiaceae bacterium]|jgi:3-oxoadipate enol-lactonase
MSYVRTRLGRWFYEERGKAKREGDPTIVLMHGLLFDGGMWRAQVEPLAALGRVIVIDGPGHGKSESPPRFTLEDHADALAIDAFSELKINKSILVGLSWGGMLAMRAAIQHPMRVTAQALLDTSAGPETLGDKVRYRAFIAFCRRYGVPRWFVDRELASLMFSPKTLAERGDELLERFTRTVNGYPRDGMARAALAVTVHRKDITMKLRGIAAPTLVICGRHDKSTPPAKSREMAAKIRDAKLEWIDDCGHMSAIERPDAVNELVVPFVKTHVERG